MKRLEQRPPQLQLYVRPGCHLCDEAREALAFTGLYPQVQEQDIDRDPALSSIFGTRIPVLARIDTGESLDWPFGPSDIREFAGSE